MRAKDHLSRYADLHWSKVRATSDDSGEVNKFYSVNDVPDLSPTYAHNWRPKDDKDDTEDVEYLDKIHGLNVLRQFDIFLSLYQIKKRKKIDSFSNYLECLDLLQKSPYRFSWCSSFPKDDDHGKRYQRLWNLIWEIHLSLLKIKWPTNPNNWEGFNKEDGLKLMKLQGPRIKFSDNEIGVENTWDNSVELIYDDDSDDENEPILDNWGELDEVGNMKQIGPLIYNEFNDCCRLIESIMKYLEFGSHDERLKKRREFMEILGLNDDNSDDIYVSQSLAVRMIRKFDDLLFGSFSFVVCHKITQQVKDGFYWPLNLGLDIYHLSDQYNSLRAGSNYHFAANSFTTLCDARNLQLVFKFFWRKCDVEEFNKMIFKAVHFTETTCQPTGINAYAWNDTLIDQLNHVHTVVYEGLRLIIIHVIDDANKNRENRKRISVAKKTYLLEIMTLILQMKVPVFILQYVEKFGGLFSENNNFLPYQEDEKPCNLSSALSYLYSTFFVKAFVEGRKQGADEYHAPPTKSDSKVYSIGKRSYPDTSILLDILLNNNYFNDFMKRATFTDVTDDDVSALMDPQLDEGSDFLFDVVLKFYNHIKGKRKWTQNISGNWHKKQQHHGVPKKKRKVGSLTNSTKKKKVGTKKKKKDKGSGVHGSVGREVNDRDNEMMDADVMQFAAEESANKGLETNEEADGNGVGDGLSDNNDEAESSQKNNVSNNNEASVESGAGNVGNEILGDYLKFFEPFYDDDEVGDMYGAGEGTCDDSFHLETQAQLVDDENLNMSDYHSDDLNIDDNTLKSLEDNIKKKLVGLWKCIQIALGELKDLEDPSYLPNYDNRLTIYQSNEPASFVKEMLYLEKKGYINQNTTFLDLGSGKGFLCILMAAICGVPSFGIEKSGFLAMQSFLTMRYLHDLAIRQEAPFESCAMKACHFKEYDILHLKSFHTFTFIFVASLGMVDEVFEHIVDLLKKSKTWEIFVCMVHSDDVIDKNLLGDDAPLVHEFSLPLHCSSDNAGTGTYLLYRNQKKEDPTNSNEGDYHDVVYDNANKDISREELRKLCDDEGERLLSFYKAEFDKTRKTQNSSTDIVSTGAEISANTSVGDTEHQIISEDGRKRVLNSSSSSEIVSKKAKNAIDDFRADVIDLGNEPLIEQVLTVIQKNYVLTKKDKISTQAVSVPTCKMEDCNLERTNDFLCAVHTNLFSMTPAKETFSSNEDRNKGNRGGKKKNVKDSSACSNNVTVGYQHKTNNCKKQCLTEDVVPLLAAKDLRETMEPLNAQDLQFFNLVILAFMSLNPEPKTKYIPIVPNSELVSNWHRDYENDKKMKPVFLKDILLKDEATYCMIFPNDTACHFVYVQITVTDGAESGGALEKVVSFIVKDNFYKEKHVSPPAFGRKTMREDYDPEEICSWYRGIFDDHLFPFIAENNSNFLVRNGGTVLKSGCYLQCVPGENTCGINATLALLFDVFKIDYPVCFNLVDELKTFEKYHRFLSYAFMKVYMGYLDVIDPDLYVKEVGSENNSETASLKYSLSEAKLDLSEYMKELDAEFLSKLQCADYIFGSHFFKLVKCQHINEIVRVDKVIEETVEDTNEDDVVPLRSTQDISVQANAIYSVLENTNVDARLRTQILTQLKLDPNLGLEKNKTTTKGSNKKNNIGADSMADEGATVTDQPEDKNLGNRDKDPIGADNVGGIGVLNATINNNNNNEDDNISTTELDNVVKDSKADEGATVTDTSEGKNLGNSDKDPKGGNNKGGMGVLNDTINKNDNNGDDISTSNRDDKMKGAHDKMQSNTNDKGDGGKNKDAILTNQSKENCQLNDAIDNNNNSEGDDISRTYRDEIVEMMKQDKVFLYEKESTIPIECVIPMQTKLHCFIQHTLLIFGHDVGKTESLNLPHSFEYNQQDMEKHAERCYDLLSSDGDELLKKLRHCKNDNLRFCLCPFPSYLIEYPQGHKKSIQNDKDKQIISPLTANVYLSGLNCITKRYTPKEREHFISSVQNYDPFADSEKLTHVVHIILNSYPRLKNLLIPYDYRDEKYILVVRLHLKVFILYSSKELSGQEKQRKGSVIRKALDSAINNDSNKRWHYDNSWDSKEMKPSTEGCCLSGERDEHSSKSGIRKPFNFQSPYLSDNFDSMKNVFVDFSGPANVDYLSKVLLIVTNILFGEDGLDRTELDCPNKDLNCYHRSISSKMIGHLPKVLTLHTWDILCNYHETTQVSDIYQDLAQKLFGRAKDSYLYNCIEKDTFCSDKCGKLPEKYRLFYDAEDDKSLQNPDEFVQLEHLSIASRALLHFNRGVDFEVFPIFINESLPRTLIVDGYLAPEFKEEIFKSNFLDDTFKFLVDQKYSSYLLNRTGDHVVYALFQIEKIGSMDSKLEGKESKQYVFHASVFDSFRGSNKKKKIFGYDRDLIKEVNNQHKEMGNDTSWKKWEEEYCNTLLTEIILPCMLKIGVHDCNETLSEDDVQVKKITCQPSVLKQVYNEDYTCGYSAFMCFVQTTLGKSIDDYDYQCLNQHKTFTEFHSTFGNLISKIIAHYLHDTNFQVKSFVCEGCEDKFVPLTQDKSFKVLYNKVVNRDCDITCFNSNLEQMLSFFQRNDIEQQNALVNASSSNVCEDNENRSQNKVSSSNLLEQSSNANRDNDLCVREASSSSKPDKDESRYDVFGDLIDLEN